MNAQQRFSAAESLDAMLHMVLFAVEVWPEGRVVWRFWAKAFVFLGGGRLWKDLFLLKQPFFWVF